MDSVLAELDSLPPGDAVFDLDGTLIHHDIGEAVYKRLIASGHTRGTWADYERMDPVPQAILAARSLAGLGRSDVASLVDACFADGDISPNEPICALAAAVARRHRVWILTGSAEVLGQLVAPRLGIDHVIGLRVASIDGRLTDRVVEPVTIAEGKVRACWVALGRRPVFAIGDSPWDVHVLRFARVARTTGRAAGQEFAAFATGTG